MYAWLHNVCMHAHTHLYNQYLLKTCTCACVSIYEMFCFAGTKTFLKTVAPECEKVNSWPTQQTCSDNKTHPAGGWWPVGCPPPHLVILSQKHSNTCQPEDLTGFLWCKGNTHWTNHIPGNIPLNVNHSETRRAVCICLKSVFSLVSANISVYNRSLAGSVTLISRIPPPQTISSSLHHGCLVSQRFNLHHTLTLQVHMFRYEQVLQTKQHTWGEKRKTCGFRESTNREPCSLIKANVTHVTIGLWDYFRAAHSPLLFTSLKFAFNVWYP